MKSLVRCLLFVLCGLVAALAFPTRGDAIPAFARRMSANCAQCHLIPGELNLTGKDFLKRGFREFEEITPDVEPGVAMAIPALETPAGPPAGEKTGLEQEVAELRAEVAELRAEQDAMAGVPTLSDYVTVAGEYSFEAEEGATSTFGPGVFELLAGGPLSPGFSFFSEVEAGIGDTSDESEVEVEEFYGQYTSGIGTDYATVRFGSFQPILLTTHQSGPPRTILERPVVLSGRAANGNGWRPRSRLRGVELGLIRGNFAGYAALGNGEGQNVSDSHMDYYVTLEQILDDNGSSIGVWTFSGDTPLVGAAAPADGRDDFRRYGVLGNYATERSKVTAAYLTGDNESSAGDLDNDGFFVQYLHMVGEDAAVYARWDDFERDLVGGGTEETDGVTIGGRIWMASQFALTLEGRLLETDGVDEDTLEAEIHWLY